MKKRSIITLKTDGNPEGKGINAFMVDWHRSQPRGVVAKPHRQLLAEFFTSMLILSANFKFRPVVGSAYYLYWIDNKWSLSPIAPSEWTEQRREAYIGRCSLQRDMTWTIEPCERLNNKKMVSEAISKFYDAFANMLDTDRVIEDILPFYVDKMPYYQRLYASALSRSVYASMTMGDKNEDHCQTWQLLLTEHNDLRLT